MDPLSTLLVAIVGGFAGAVLPATVSLIIDRRRREDAETERFIQLKRELYAKLMALATDRMRIVQLQQAARAEHMGRVVRKEAGWNDRPELGPALTLPDAEQAAQVANEVVLLSPPEVWGAARKVVKAMHLTNRRFALVADNPPYLYGWSTFRPGAASARSRSWPRAVRRYNLLIGRFLENAKADLGIDPE